MAYVEHLVVVNNTIQIGLVVANTGHGLDHLCDLWCTDISVAVQNFGGHEAMMHLRVFYDMYDKKKTTQKNIWFGAWMPLGEKFEK